MFDCENCFSFGLSNQGRSNLSLAHYNVSRSVGLVPSSAKFFLKMLVMAVVAIVGLMIPAYDEASAQILVKEYAQGIIKRLVPHDSDPCTARDCIVKLALDARSRGSIKLERVTLKLGNSSFNSTTLLKRSCLLSSGGQKPYILGKRTLIAPLSCLNVSTKRLNRKNSGQIDLAKFLESLNLLRAQLISQGISAAAADQLIDLIKGVVNASLVQGTATPTPTPTRTQVATTATPTPGITAGPQCAGARVDNTSYPCRDGNVFSVIYYPVGCDYSARPLCPTGYSESNRVCLSNGQCQLNCRRSCSACAVSQFKDDTTSYPCSGGVEYTIRYHPNTCSTSCPTGFTSDYQGCKDNGECQINCKKSCSGTPSPTTTVTRTPTAIPSTTVTVTATATPSSVPTRTAGLIINRCDSKYVMANGVCKFGMKGNLCYAASLADLNTADQSTVCMNIHGTMTPFRGCEEGGHLGRNCARDQARDPRCDSDRYRDYPYITSFGRESGLKGIFCCSQPTVGGSQPPAAGVVCREIPHEDLSVAPYNHSFPVSDPATLQPSQRVDCRQGGLAYAMENCGTTPNNPFGNGTCGYGTIFGHRLPFSAPVISTALCCSGRANYVSSIIAPNGRRAELANYECCGAQGDPSCRG